MLKHISLTNCQVPLNINDSTDGNSISKSINSKLNTLKESLIILLIFLVGKPINRMAASSSRTSLKTTLEMAIHELCTAQERTAEVHSIIYEDIHPRINQALAGLDED